MSKYASSLRRRLASRASLHQTVEWFIRATAAEPKIRKSDFTPLELAFWNEIVRGYRRVKKVNVTFWDNALERYLRLVKLHRVS